MSDVKKSHGSGSGSEMVYLVEARSTFTEPQEANGMTLDNRWRVVTFAPSPVGVKNSVWSAEARAWGKYLTYEAALTLAHLFLTNADRGYCLETRLVKIKLSYSHSTEEIGVTQPMSHFRAECDAPFSDREPDPSAAPPDGRRP